MRHDDPNIGKGMSLDEYLVTLPDSIKHIVCKRKPAHVNQWCCKAQTELICEKIPVINKQVKPKTDIDETIATGLFWGFIVLYLIIYIMDVIDDIKSRNNDN